MIFLGQASNYRGAKIWQHLFAHGTKRDLVALRTALAERYQSSPERVQLYHTGRSALAAAILSVAPSGTNVIVPGLTCIAVVRAVRAAHSTPTYVDINPKTLQYDFPSLEKTLKALSQSTPIDKTDKVCYNGIILAQNTLGLPLDAAKLEQLAQKYHFAIIEDLAHSAGRYYRDGREIGTIGVATALSFGKGKAIDTIEGGAAILRQTQLVFRSSPRKQPYLADRWRDRWYPILGWFARGFWHLGLGRLWLGLCLKLHFIQRSADATLDLDRTLTSWQAKLALKQLPQLPRTPLRCPYYVQHRAELLQKLSRSGYELAEIWYDVPVSPARYAKEAKFSVNTCPNTIWAAEHLINLPTWYPEAKLRPVYQLIKPYLIEPAIEPSTSPQTKPQTTPRPKSSTMPRPKSSTTPRPKSSTKPKTKSPNQPQHKSSNEQEIL